MRLELRRSPVCLADRGRPACCHFASTGTLAAQRDGAEPLDPPELEEVLEGCSAVYRAAFFAATWVSASSSASCSGPFFKVANVSPASTVSPTATLTLFTVPLTLKAAASVFFLVLVPVAV